MAFEINSHEVTGFAGMEDARNEVKYILKMQDGGIEAYDVEAIMDEAIYSTGETWGGAPVYALVEHFWDIVIKHAK